jgi:hypothetical protein
MSAITQQDRGLLALILSPAPLAELLEKSGLPIDQLLDWFDSPPIRRLVERLQAFAALRTTLTAALAGPKAASALSTLLEATDNPVERRRLATTLIRTGKPARPRRSKGTASGSERASSPSEDPLATEQQWAPSPAAALPAPSNDSIPTRAPAPAAAPPNPFRKPTRVTTLMHRAGAAELPRAG